MTSRGTRSGFFSFRGEDFATAPHCAGYLAEPNLRRSDPGRRLAGCSSREDQASDGIRGVWRSCRDDNERKREWPRGERWDLWVKSYVWESFKKTVSDKEKVSHPDHGIMIQRDMHPFFSNASRFPSCLKPARGTARNGLGVHAAWFSMLVWLLLQVPLTAQEASRIEGRIANEDGIGISGVTVTIQELGMKTITEPDGRYAFEGVPLGMYELSFRLREHTVVEQVQVSGRSAAVATVVDWPAPLHFSITVTAAARHPQRIVEAPAAVTTVESEEIQLQASHGQLPRLLAFSPGVEVTQNGLYDFNFNTRGFNSAINRRVLTLIDGRDPSVPEFLGTQEWAAISFPLDQLDNVELVRGPTAALYGAGAFNGILNFTTKGARDSRGGKARITFGELDTLRTDLLQAGSLGHDWYFKFAGGYSKSDDFTVSRNTSVEYEPELISLELIPLPFDRVETAYGSFRLDKHFSSDTVLDIEAGTGYFEGVTVINPLGRSQAGRVQRPWARLNFISPQWSFLTYYSGRNGNDQRGLSTGASLYSNGYNFGSELQMNRMFADENGRVIAGVSYGRQGADSADPQGVQGIFAGPEQANRGAGFGQVEYDITKKLKGVFSGRLDAGTLHHARFSPRGALVYGLTPVQALRVSYSNAFQAPTLVERAVRTAVAPPLDLSPLEASLAPVLGGVSLGFQNVPLLALGNEDLLVEEIRTFEVGYTGVLGRNMFVTLSYFHNDLKNFTTQFLPNVGTSLG